MIAIFLFVLNIVSASEVYGQVVINEINPSGEWVELLKTSTGPITLDSCTFFSIMTIVKRSS